MLVIALLVFGGFVVDAKTDNTRSLKLVVQENGGKSTSFTLYDKITAVIIGVDRYQTLPAKNYLKYAVSDAKGVEEVLRERYPISKIITLYNEQATRDNIMKVLQGDLSGVGPDDAVLVYYAGHGITRTTQQKKLGYFIPYDGSLEMTEMHKNISMQQISSDISPLVPAKHMLFVMDACFGGLLLSTRGIGVEPSHKTAYLEEITREQVRQIITAGGEGEEVLDEGGLYGHSVFTGRFIEALKNNKEFITAQELGMELEQKVYGDARAKGHKQRPQVGKIYGTGDFVFVPDVEKVSKQAEDEAGKIEAEIKALENLKIEAGRRQDEAKLREIERDRLVKEAELKQARLREEAARKDAELQKLREAEALRSAEGQKQQEKEKIERLAYLKQQSKKMKAELGSPSAALGLDQAQAEIKRLNGLIAKINGDFNGEMEKQRASIRGYYQGKIDKVEAQPSRDMMFETEADYNTRISQAKQEADILKSELAKQASEIEAKVKADLAGQLQALEDQKAAILKQEFQLGPKDIIWKFEKYDPESEIFRISITMFNEVFIVWVPVPKKKAKEYYQNPDLLIAQGAVSFTDDGGISLAMLALQGPAGDRYQAGIAGAGEVYVAGLFWQKKDDGIERNWNKAISYCQSLALGGSKDWRLPSKDELSSLVDKKYTPTIDPVFTDTKTSYYWSSTSGAGSTDYAWYVSFGNGYVSSSDNTYDYYVRCVRGGQ